jgi:outer membrane autotransporter protein
MTNNQNRQLKINISTRIKPSFILSALLLSTCINAADRLPYQDYVLAAGGNSDTQSAAAIIQTNNNNVFNDIEDDISDFFDANNYDVKTAVEKAIATTTPKIATANAEAGSQIMSSIQGIVGTRQNNALGLNSGDSLMKDKQIWFKPYFSSGAQNDKNGISGFDLKARGFGIGIDGEYDINNRIGFSLFYTQADVDVNNVSQSSDIDVISALIYGNIPIINNKTTLLYQLGYSIQDTTSTRNIFNGDVAKSDYTSTTISANIKIMQNYHINDNLMVEPFIGLTYSKQDNDAYKESGAGVLNLKSDSFNSTELIAKIGTQAKYKINENSSILANLHLGYDLNNDVTTVTSSYQGDIGTTFDTNGIDNGQFNYQAGIGYQMKNVLGGEINFMYNYQAKGSDFSNNTFSSKYVLKF